METPSTALRARGLTKHFRGAPPSAGLNGFSLEVPRGTVCGLIGPNGAGKTTSLRILTTLLRADEGTAEVEGFDVAAQAARVRERIGLVGQQTAVDEILDGRQNLVLFGRLRHLSVRDARTRADELLDRFGLSGAGRNPVARYSGGMRRRLDLALSLIAAPSVLFVDEPTAGLDPAGRQEVWTALKGLVAQGTTILLTTQYLEEADALADHIAFLKEGRVIAEGTPDQLKALLGGDWIDVVPSNPGQDSLLQSLAARVASGPLVAGDQGKLSIPVTGRTKALVEFAAALQGAGIDPLDLTLRRPTLDEVFLHLTQTPNQEVHS